MAEFENDLTSLRVLTGALLERFYDAGPGWDAATGWGTPDAAILDRDFKAYIKAGGK